MKLNKILAAILALTILVGCFALPVGAASADEVLYANNPKAEDKNPLYGHEPRMGQDRILQPRLPDQ